MSYVKFCIFDADRSISGDLHGSMTEPLVAALTAEPESIEEFEIALQRFVEFRSDWSIFRGFAPHENLEPYDASIVAIDLAARVCAIDSTYDQPGKEGGVRVPRGFSDEDGDIVVPYRVPDDWTFMYSIVFFEGTAAHRRSERSRNPPVDVREILYGEPLLRFIADELWSTLAAECEEAVPDIHARWMVTPSAELRGLSPREALFEKQGFVNVELNSRMAQWSYTKVCPPPIAADSYAYRYAGFGTHEIVMHYEMVRAVMWEACDILAADAEIPTDDLVARLAEAKAKFLDSPDAGYRGLSPSQLIDQERRRINLTSSAHDVLIDENCASCVDLSEDFDTPMFWFLDGCNMDHRFEFSFCRTREEWDEEQRRFEEFSSEFDRKWTERGDMADPFDEEPF